MKQSELRHKQLEHQNRRLQLRVQELELQAKAHGLPVSDFTWASTSAMLNSFPRNKLEQRKVSRKALSRLDSYLITFNLPVDISSHVISSVVSSIIQREFHSYIYNNYKFAHVILILILLSTSVLLTIKIYPHFFIQLKRVLYILYYMQYEIFITFAIIDCSMKLNYYS